MTASSNTDNALLGITKFSSMPITLPKPSQVGHAPTGLLKLNMRSFGSSKVIPSASNRFENVCSSIPFSV